MAADFVGSEKSKIYQTPSLFNLNHEVQSNKEPPQRMISFGSKVQSFGNKQLSNYNSVDSPLTEQRGAVTPVFDGMENIDDEDLSEFEGGANSQDVIN